MRFIFVGGCERSGTTLVQRVLAAHSRIVGGPEFVFTPDVAVLYQRMAGDYPAPWADRVGAHYTSAELRSAVSEFYSGFFERLRKSKPEAIYVTEKTPANIRVAGILLELFPDAFFVHVIRDGRDVVASHRAVLRRLRAQPDLGFRPAGFGLRAVCARWNRAVDTHFDLRDNDKLTTRYLALRYEDLASDPERTLTDLMGALELRLERHLLSPGELGDGTATVPVDGFWTTEAMLTRPFDSTSVGRWREDLSLVTRLAGDLLMKRNLRRMSYIGD